MGQISLEEALELLALMGRFGDKRFDRAAVQGLQRLLDEQALSLVDVQIAAANIAALATATRASAVGARRRFVRHGATRQVPAREDRVCARPVAEKKRLPLAPTSTAAGVARHLRLSPGCRSGAEPVWFLGGAVRPAPVAYKKCSAVFPCATTSCSWPRSANRRTRLRSPERVDLRPMVESRPRCQASEA